MNTVNSLSPVPSESQQTPRKMLREAVCACMYVLSFLLTLKSKTDATKNKLQLNMHVS